MNLTLDRFAYSPLGTFGRIDELGMYTVERQWDGNKTGVSCIPEGTYRCARVNSPKFGNVFEVTEVPGRTHILFHKANVARDVEGCIGVGEKLGVVGMEWAVTGSRIAFDRMMIALEFVSEFTLTITATKRGVLHE